MGYPMTYGRMISRNGLGGGYGHNPEIKPTQAYPDPQSQQPENKQYSLIAGDLRRLEQDQRDDQHLKEYAKRTKLTEAQVLHVLDLLFEGNF